MIEFHQILFPVDFSDQARAVAPSVKAMAKRFGAEITVLHASASVPDADLKLALDRFVGHELAGARVSQQVVNGDPAEEIVKYARGHRSDLIMMPTRGHGIFRAMLLGSVTAKVLHDTACPVWTGIHAAELTAHPPDRWKHLLCAVDDIDGKDVSVIKWAAEFARNQNMELLLVHAVAGTEGMWIKERDPSMYEFLFNSARSRLAELQAIAGTTAASVLIGGTVASAVHQAATESRPDLIVVGRSANHTLRGNAYAIIREAPCPVISI